MLTSIASEREIPNVLVQPHISFALFKSDRILPRERLLWCGYWLVRETVLFGYVNEERSL